MISNPNKQRRSPYKLIYVAAVVLAAAASTYAASPVASFPDYYPDTFSGVGRVVRVEAPYIVIDDQQYILSPRVTYHTLRREYAFQNDFKPGMLVGFITGTKNEIVSLWFIEK